MRNSKIGSTDISSLGSTITGAISRLEVTQGLGASALTTKVAVDALFSNFQTLQRWDYRPRWFSKSLTQYLLNNTTEVTAGAFGWCYLLDETRMQMLLVTVNGTNMLANLTYEYNKGVVGRIIFK